MRLRERVVDFEKPPATVAGGGEIDSVCESVLYRVYCDTTRRSPLDVDYAPSVRE